VKGLQGLCRSCGDKWDKDHKQKCKVWGKLNAVFSAQWQRAVKLTSELDGEQENEIIKHSLNLIMDADVHISHTALQGVAGGNTLQIKGWIKKQAVPFLMDTGSTHNFISANRVKALGLKSHSLSNFRVMVASDKELV